MALGPEKMPHAMVVPASGQGHIKPCMLLARALAALGFDVSFIHFSSQYAKLDPSKQRLPEPGSTAHTVGGGEGAPSSNGGRSPAGRGQPVSTAKIEKGLLGIYVVEDGIAQCDVGKPFFSPPAMQENLLNLILELREQGRAPNCLVADPFYPWTQHVAERAGIPFIVFWTASAMAYLLIHLTPHFFSQGIFPEKDSSTPLMLDLIPGLPPFSSELCIPQVRSADASHPMLSFLCDIASCSRNGERMLLHALPDLEPDAFHALQVVGISGFAIGPLLHHDAKKQEDGGASVQAQGRALKLTSGGIDCMAWLNTQAESSVIYVSFGSKAKISAQDIQELALGLEACGNAFLWVIRDDSRGGGGLSQMLPEGFLERTSEKGMIIKWAPQAEVLAHKAVGGFLTHCGWNSTLESLWEGVPMLCCPLGADQFLNSHFMCDVWGVGLELRRTHTRSIERRNVEVGVKGLLQGEEGLKARGKVRAVKELARTTCQQGGQSFSNLQKFYEDMKQLCCKQ